MFHARIARMIAMIGAAFATSAAFATGNLEVPAPGSTQSGVDAISGWHCTASKIEISIDNGPRMAAGTRTERLDTLGICGRIDTGFALTYNWNLLPVTCFGCRFHSIVAYADGVQFASARFEAENFRTEFLTGKNGQYNLYNFPEIGSDATVRWDESRQNFTLWLATRNIAISIGGPSYGALRTGAQNPACGPFPPNRVIGTKLGVFTVQLTNSQISLAIDYADGTTCRLPAVTVPSLDAENQNGYVIANFDATAAAACPEFPNGFTIRANGNRIVGDSKDFCVTAHVIGAK